MARSKSKKKKKELFVGACSLVFVFGVLLVVAFGLFSGNKTELPPAPAPTAEPTLPPPEENPYSPEDFQYDGKYLTCLSGESVLGIDVSYHQGDIDWQKVKESGVEFVMIRIGYRGYETGQDLQLAAF